MKVVRGRGTGQFKDDRLLSVAARKPIARNDHLEEAMALLIRNQAAFVEQIARNDQERLAVRDWQHRSEVWQHKTEEWQRRAEERFDKIDERLSNIEATLVQLPKIILQTILEQLPKAVKKEIGFTLPV